jgi:hypothetical protein
MDNLQDIGYNRLHILDDTEADKDKSGCAVFEGGINVEKNILAKSICCDNIETEMLKIFNNLIIQNNIKIGRDIIPIHQYNSCTIGNKINKWQKIYCVEGLYSNIISNTINTNNLNVNIYRPSTKIILINNLINNCININLDNIFIYIIIENIEHQTIKLILDKPICKNEYHKIILKQNNCNIKININNICCDDIIQIYEIISFDGVIWFIIPNFNIPKKKNTLLLEYKSNCINNINDFKHVIIPSLENDPNNIEGSLYINSKTHDLKICINGKWKCINLI